MKRKLTRPVCATCFAAAAVTVVILTFGPPAPAQGAGSRSTTPTTAPATQRGRTRVSLNADGVLTIDGRKVFPVGFTMPPPPEGKTPAGHDAIGELRLAGANFLRTGVMGGDMRHGGAGTAWDEAGIDLEL